MIYGCLPLVCFFVLYLITLRLQKDPASCRSVLLSTAVIWGVFLGFGTELLGRLHQITFPAVLGFWTLLLILSLLGLLSLRRPWPKIRFDVEPWSLLDVLFFAGMAVIIFVIFLISVSVPPNNYDSMAYHMSRVMHWIQNKSIAFYPTQDLRQLVHPPWSEYAILHFQVLTASDRMVNLVQWFSMVGSVIGVSTIARQLGADRRAQVYAALAAATLPMGILQSSSTQNDYTVTFWLICFVHFLLGLQQQPRRTTLLAAGASLGLALLTKNTAFFFAIPALIWHFLSGWPGNRAATIKSVMQIFLIAFVLNLPQFSRNQDMCGHPLSCPAIMDVTTNEEMSLPLFASNVIRNLSLHWASPFKEFNTGVMNVVTRLHEVVDLDVSDRRVTYEKHSYHIGGYTFHEDYAGNFLHHLIILFLIGWYLPKTRNAGARRYFITLLAVMVMMNLYLRWMPWNVRHHLPFFVLSCPIIGLAAADSQRMAWKILMVVLLLSSMLWVFHNQNRPILTDRTSILETKYPDQYFLATPGFKDSYKGVAADVPPCAKVGIWLEDFSWEYPLWVLLKGAHIEAVNVDNPSAKYDTGFEPCAIVSNKPNALSPLIVNGKNYALAREYRVLKLYLAEQAIR